MSPHHNPRAQQQNNRMLVVRGSPRVVSSAHTLTDRDRPLLLGRCFGGKQTYPRTAHSLLTLLDRW